MRSSLLDRRRIHEHLNVMRSILALAVNTLEHDLLRALVAKKKPFVQLFRNVIDAFVRAEDALSDRLPDLVNKPVHVEVLKHTRNNGVREKISSGKRKHETRSDACQRLKEVGRILHEVIYQYLEPQATHTRTY